MQLAQRIAPRYEQLRRRASGRNRRSVSCGGRQQLRCRGQRLQEHFICWRSVHTRTRSSRTSGRSAALQQCALRIDATENHRSPALSPYWAELRRGTLTSIKTTTRTRSWHMRRRHSRKISGHRLTVLLSLGCRGSTKGAPERARRAKRQACRCCRTVAIYTESNWDEAGGVTMSSPHKVTLRLILRSGLGLFRHLQSRRKWQAARLA